MNMKPSIIAVPFKDFSINPTEKDILQVLAAHQVKDLNRLCILPKEKRGKEILVIVCKRCVECNVTEQIAHCAKYVCLLCDYTNIHRCKVAFLCDTHKHTNHVYCADLGIWNGGGGDVKV